MQDHSSLHPHRFAWQHLALFLVLLASLVLGLGVTGGLSVEHYIQIQTNWFLWENHLFRPYAEFEHNVTYLGDALVALSLLTPFLVIKPKVFQSALTASLICLMLSPIFKNSFQVPRPAAILDPNTFYIVGEKLTGHNSMPSGHSATIFIALLAILLYCLPKERFYRGLWIFSIILLGLFLAASRTAVGAHWPLDTFGGALLGYLCVIGGSFLTEKYPLPEFLKPITFRMITGAFCGVALLLLALKFFQNSLPVIAFAGLFPLFTLFQMFRGHV